MQDARNFQFSSDYPMPYFVYKASTSVTASARGTATARIEHKLGFTPLVVGQWSPDNKFTVTHDTTSSSSVNSIFCWVFADDTYIYVRQFNGSNSSNTIYVRVWAYPTPEYNGHLDAVSDETAFNFDSDYSYLGIYMSGSLDSDGETHTISHGLGYVPQCKMWVGGNFAVDGGQSVNAIAQVSSYINTSRPMPNYAITKEDLIIGTTYSSDGKIYYHIYSNEV